MAAALRRLPVAAKEALTPAWSTFVKYGKVELMPPSPAEIPAAFGQAARLVQGGLTFRWTKLSVREAWINTLVTAEVACWFFVGECIGKGSLAGYQV